MKGCGVSQCAFGGGNSDLYCGQCYRAAVAEREALRAQLGPEPVSAEELVGEIAALLKDAVRRSKEQAAEQLFGVWVPMSDGQGGQWVTLDVKGSFTTKNVAEAMALASNLRNTSAFAQRKLQMTDQYINTRWAEFGPDGQPIFHDDK